MIDEKIREILNNYLEVDVWAQSTVIKEVTQQLKDLITQEKKEAVREFVSSAGEKFREFCDLVRKELDIFVMIADVESGDVQDWEYMQSFDSFLYFPVAEDDEENTIYYKTSFTPLEILLHEDAWKDIIEQIRTSKKTYLTQQSLDGGEDE